MAAEVFVAVERLRVVQTELPTELASLHTDLDKNEQRSPTVERKTRGTVL